MEHPGGKRFKIEGLEGFSFIPHEGSKGSTVTIYQRGEDIDTIRIQPGEEMESQIIEYVSRYCF